jgi:hypothetical protein
LVGEPPERYRAEWNRRRTKKLIAAEEVRPHVPEAFWPLVDKRARYKGFYGGRGSAKTHSFAAALVITAALRPLRVLCCREIQRSIRESVKFTLDSKIAALGLSDDYDSTQTQLRSTAGSHFFFEGLRSNPLSIQSLEGIDYVWVEEASTISQTSLDILIPTVRKPRSELWFSWNPRNATDPVDRYFRKGTEDIEKVDRAGYDRWMVAQRVSYEGQRFFPRSAARGDGARQAPRPGQVRAHPEGRVPRDLGGAGVQELAHRHVEVPEGWADCGRPLGRPRTRQSAPRMA